ncbi:HD domain-containing protein [Actinospica sp. MGRD01-02]|uniref:HD domain-containing protein n=1 Tax=Actinospica acidithermotolerans TaxID=2828514 RepID=A0A941EEZ8_9ACTN|nr:HD domain-containing protein [Actinospica acidithermotolerans]MBR7830251.1 HD domain-containing protein [Actinospica acidithermotolerans]
MELLTWARELAEQLLAEPLPRRWAHSQGVGRRAESLAGVLGKDAELLAAAAWLHDIGYAPELVKTGMHQLDGARYLRDNASADPRLCSLVAHHSCACIEARNRGMHAALEAEFPPVGGLLADALTYSDMTTTPDGRTTDVEDRLAEILERYEAGSVVFESISEASPRIVDAAHRISELIGAQR